MERARKDKGSKKTASKTKKVTESKSNEQKVFAVSSVKPSEWLAKSKTGIILFVRI